MDKNDLEAILGDPSHPDYITVINEMIAQYSQQYNQTKPLPEKPCFDDGHGPMEKSSSSHMVLSPWDRNQALKHHPEFQRCLMVWQVILAKEQDGIPLTAEEESMKWTPRSGFNVQAEMEASQYGLLSLEESERATMSKEELAWRDIDPKLDYPNKVAVVSIPLRWTRDAIKQIVRRVVRTYKTRTGLSDAKYHGPPLQPEDLSPSLVLDTLTLRIPLKPPVKMSDPVVDFTVRTYQDELKITSSQEVKRPGVDPWEVRWLHHEADLSFIDIVRELFDIDPDATPANDDDVKRLYDQVRDAYQFSDKAIERIGQIYGTFNG